MSAETNDASPPFSLMNFTVTAAPFLVQIRHNHLRPLSRKEDSSCIADAKSRPAFATPRP